MTKINGYFLTEAEESACADLIKKMRERKLFAVDFSGYAFIKAKTREEANDIFWEWVGDLQDKSLADWSDDIVQPPYFDNDGIEEK